LKCQYHGWEYDKTGKTARIPEARCFRPWDRENSQLVTYRLEACGDLLFVALTDEAPPLREWLNPYFESPEQEFSPPEWRMRWAWEYDAACNWKVPAENTLESYHIPSLHARSFGGLYPREESTQHRLAHRYTELNYRQTSWIELEASKVRRLLGGNPAERYIHRHIHPHTILVTTDTLNFALMYHPTSARTVRIRMRLFGFQGPRRDPFSGFFAWLTWKFGKSATVRILTEDRDVYVSQQRGIEASHQPGVIGTREERIYAFQEYILKSLGLPIPLPRSQDSTLADSDDAAAFHEAWNNGEPIMNEIAGTNGERDS